MTEIEEAVIIPSKFSEKIKLKFSKLTGGGRETPSERKKDAKSAKKVW